MSSRYERRRERDSEPDERIQRSISPGPPRKRSRTDAEQPSSRSVYQRPRSPSPSPHPSTPSYPAAANHHKPSETPTPNAKSHQDDRNKLSPKLRKTPQNTFATQTTTSPPRDHKDSPNAPLKISSALATLSSSTALSSILSRTDGAENPQRATNSLSQSPAPASKEAPALGMSATQFDLAKLHSLSQALQNHGPMSATPSNGNSNAHVQKPTVLATEPRATHPTTAERSSSSLVRCLTLCFKRSAIDCLRRRRHLILIGNMSVLCTMKENLANAVLQQALVRVNDHYIVVDIERRALDQTPIILTTGTGR